MRLSSYGVVVAVCAVASVAELSEAATLSFEAMDLSQLYGLPNSPEAQGQVSGLTNGGDVLHRTFTFPVDAGGAGVATEMYLEHPGGSRTTFVVPYAQGTFSEVRLNNLGEVAVTVFPDRTNIDLTTREIWVYSATGIPTKIEGFTGGAENLSFNDAGQIAVSNTDEDRAFRYTPGVGWENLGSLSNDGFAVPRAINNAGAVVGGTSVGASNLVTPFLYRDGTGMEDIPAPFGLGRAINDNFVVTGDGGWVYYADEMRLEYIFMGQAFGFIRPRDINDPGAIVGISQGGLESIAFHWDADDGRQLLSEVVTDPTWTINEATAINNDGWILAYGHYGDDRLNDSYSWLLLRPIPEPTAPLLVMVSGLALSWRRRRKV